MNVNAKPASIYFSAYPLKAVEKAAESASEIVPPSPFLRAVLSGKTKAIARIRVFPMINPYQEKHARPVANAQSSMDVDKALSRVIGKEVYRRKSS